MSNPILTARQVHKVRTAGLTDAYWCKRLGVSYNVVRHARIGRTWRAHKTPPDVRPRFPGGRLQGRRARFQKRTWGISP